MSRTREIIKIDKEIWDDYTCEDSWELNGETYVFVEDYPSKDCDGECHNVIVERLSDDKTFKFTWQYYHDNYYYGDELTEVFPKTITKTTYL